MKDLEKSFFKFCCKNLSHDNDALENLFFRMKDMKGNPLSISNHLSFDDLIQLYIEQHKNRLDLPKDENGAKKQLRYYVHKWEKIGFAKTKMRIGKCRIPCNVSVFDFFGYIDNYIKFPYEYAILIPRRISMHCKAICYYIKEANNSINLAKKVYLDSMTSYGMHPYRDTNALMENRKYFYPKLVK